MKNPTCILTISENLNKRIEDGDTCMDNIVIPAVEKTTLIVGFDRPLKIDHCSTVNDSFDRHSDH